MNDARFEDGAEVPLRLQALDADDLQVVSALVQDAVFPVTEIRYQPRKRRFAVLLNRFRWEDQSRAASAERVQSLLVFEDVLRVASAGFDRHETDLVMSLLTLVFEPGEDGAGQITLTLAGDGEIRLDIECIDISLRDVTRPYLAPSGRTPHHKLED